MTPRVILRKKTKTLLVGPRAAKAYAGWYAQVARMLPRLWARERRKAIDPHARAFDFLRYAEHEVTALWGRHVTSDAAAASLLRSYKNYLAQ